MRTVHIITRLIVGGAQENTLHTVDDQHHLFGDEVTLLTGPGLGPEGSLEDRAQQRGLNVRLIPEFHRAIKPAQDLASYRAIVRLLKNINPEIVHTHSSKAGILGRRAAYRLGIPCVHTVHGASFHVGQHPAAYWFYRRVERLAASWTDKFISVADAMIEQYVNAGVAPRDRFVTIHSGFDIEPFLHPPRPPQDIRKDLGLEPQHVVIGKVGRLFHLKGHEFVIRAAPELCALFPDIRFLFVGDGILRAQFERCIAELGLADRFIFTGLVRPERVADLIHAMDIVVHTSLWEGLARVLPQALIAGKPVVSYDVDGAKEVVIPGKTGYLAPPQSIAPLVEALAHLIENPGLRRRFGETGRARFTDQFRHQSMTRRIREVYAEVLDRTKSRV